jgi:hypothetical protein
MGGVKNKTTHNLRTSEAVMKVMKENQEILVTVGQ